MKAPLNETLKLPSGIGALRWFLMALISFVVMAYSAAPVRALLRVGPTWPGGVVRVCWETQSAADGSGNPINPHTRSDWEVMSAMVRDTMRSTWGRVANIEFSGFVDCPSNSEAGNGGWLAINLSTHRPVPPGTRSDAGANTTIGYWGPGRWTRMRLDAGLGSITGFMEDFRGQIIHETGHALGFEHEWDRADNPHDTGCTVADGNRNRVARDFLGTRFDIQSIMNQGYDQGASHCQLSRPFRLSAWDVVGVQNAYGPRRAGSMVAASGSCLDVPLPYTRGARVQIYECNNGPNQIWTFKRIGGFFGSFFTPHLNAYLDSFPNTRGDLTASDRDIPSAETQRWEFVRTQIRGIGDMCIDIPSGDVAAAERGVQIYTCHGGLNQKWSIRNGAIHAAQNNTYCLDIPWGNAAEQAVVRLYPCNRSRAQQFTFTNSGQILFNNKCLDVRGGTPNNHAVVQLYSCAPNAANQRWHLTTELRNPRLTWCVDVRGGSSLNRSAIQGYACHDGPNQQWDYYFNDYSP